GDRGRGEDEDRARRLVRQDRLLRLPLDPGARGQEPGANRAGPLDRSRGRAVALRANRGRLSRRPDRDDVRRPLAPDHPDPRRKESRGGEAARSVCGVPETESLAGTQGSRRTLRGEFALITNHKSQITNHKLALTGRLE